MNSENSGNLSKDGSIEGEGFNDREEIYSKVIRAGKRTYFFDVKATRHNDLFLTITESKKRFADDGSVSFDRHKIFLYKEDFKKFAYGFDDVVTYIVKNLPENNSKYQKYDPDNSSDISKDRFEKIDFDDFNKD